MGVLLDYYAKLMRRGKNFWQSLCNRNATGELETVCKRFGSNKNRLRAEWQKPFNGMNGQEARLKGRFFS
jgi:hypothetical protein